MVAVDIVLMHLVNYPIKGIVFQMTVLYDTIFQNFNKKSF